MFSANTVIGQAGTFAKEKPREADFEFKWPAGGLSVVPDWIYTSPEIYQREIERIMVRRTRSDLNRIADSRPAEYQLSTGRQARYPHHVANYYDCPAGASDLAIADSVTALADRLKGVARIPETLEMSRAVAMLGITEEQYLRRIVSSARSLASHLVLDCLRLIRHLDRHAVANASARDRRLRTCCPAGQSL